MTRFSYAEYLSLFRSSGTRVDSPLCKAPGVAGQCPDRRRRDGDLPVTSETEGDVEPIVLAIRRGDVKTVRELTASRSRSRTIENPQGWIPLHEAAYCGQAGCAEALLKAQPTSVDKRTLQEQTALMLAVDGEHLACVRCLLEGGADPDISNKNKETPLYKACEREREDLVRLILAFGGSVNQRCNRGWTALHEAASRDNADLCETLLQAGAIINSPNAYGITPLIVAAQRGRTKALAFLITKGADVNLQSCEGATALSEASKNGHRESVELLLHHSADANKPSNSGLLPLHIAAQYGHREVVSVLLPVTSRVRLRQSGVPPLHLAAEHDRREVVTFLLAAGAEVNAALSRERSALFHDHRATALYSAVAAGNAEVAAALLGAGADPNLDPLGALLVAARQGCLGTVAALVEHGADVDAGLPARPAAFPGALLCAQHPRILSYLLDNGCDAQSCFRCDHGSGPHPPIGATLGDAGSGNGTALVGADTPQFSCSESSSARLQFCEWISSPSLRHWAGPIMNLLLDYVGNIQLCARLTELLDSQQEWAVIKEKSLSPRPLMHLCRQRIRQKVGVRRLRSLHTLPLPDRLLQYLGSAYVSTTDQSFAPGEGSSPHTPKPGLAAQRRGHS